MKVSQLYENSYNNFNDLLIYEKFIKPDWNEMESG